MKKEAILYIKHIMKSEFVQMDALNTVLALFVILFALIAFLKGGRLSYFGACFVIGGVLAVFNMIKSIMKRSYMGVIAFGCGIFAMIVASIIVYGYLM